MYGYIRYDGSADERSVAGTNGAVPRNLGSESVHSSDQGPPGGQALTDRRLPKRGISALQRLNSAHSATRHHAEDPAAASAQIDAPARPPLLESRIKGRGERAVSARSTLNSGDLPASCR